MDYRTDTFPYSVKTICDRLGIPTSQGKCTWKANTSGERITVFHIPLFVDTPDVPAAIAAYRLFADAEQSDLLSDDMLPDEATVLVSRIEAAKVRNYQKEHFTPSFDIIAAFAEAMLQNNVS